MNLYENIEKEFSQNRNEQIALGQSAYMKGKFDYFGIKSPIRKEIQKHYLSKNNLPSLNQAIEVMELCFIDDHREMQYFGMDLIVKYKKHYREEDIEWMEWMILTKSWWDTVDLTATKIIGSYFKKFPNKIDEIIPKWMESENMWLQRTALLFQLKYKSETNTELLSQLIIELLGSKEFFINKAIGWVLREYGKTNPDWVIEFVDLHKDKLAPLSKKEALRILIPIKH